MKKDANLEIQKKLEYLNLDLDNVPSSITDFEPLNYSVSRLANDKDHRVYKYISIDKIEILVTPCLRTDTLRDKYSKALPLYKYILPAESDEDVEKYTTFLKMLRNVSISEIENVALIQKEVEKKEPFKVKYNKDFMWQIYYVPEEDKYFMLVCTKEETYAEFFYLLKLKLEHNLNPHRPAPRIFVPINASVYSEVFLDREEIADLTNYLWLFTKDWPLIFEVYNKNNVLTLDVIGETVVYDNVKSYYKVSLKSKDDAIKFYRLLKALFIIQTEIKDKFKFVSRIDSSNGIEFYYEDKRITYECLTDFIKEEVNIAIDDIKAQNATISTTDDELESLKSAIKIKEEEYLVKQREISVYLEYKKTFFGKVKYFFKSPAKVSGKNLKKNKKSLYDEEIPEDFKFKENVSKNVIDIDNFFKIKDLYTIEDLVLIYNLLEKSDKNLSNLKQDMKAQQLKYENLISRVNNATQYIEEIDKHRKSIFDFWKFSNKDEKLSLEMGNESEKNQNSVKLKKSFDLETDLEDLGIKADTIQRTKLSRDEQDALFIAKTGLLPILNMIRNNNLNQNLIERALVNLKNEYASSKTQTNEDGYDIFGGAVDDNTKIKFIKSKSHRETEKSKFRILNINKKIDQFDFAERLQILNNYLEGVTVKSKAVYDFSLYKVAQINENVIENGFDIYNLDVQNALNEFNDDGEGALNLIKINIKENMPMIYYTNILFYDNNNDTLPLGMDLSTSVFIDGKKFKYNLVKKDKFRTNEYFTESNNLIMPKTKDILVYEYDLELK